ncbi:hypothetical protein K474DRAFT_1738077 [Panus rudis PR-1116 ss-1]|nr:hypothetical protein K474DRAFT_1738077 [Panus rudis PR-1116 ss-1]
MPPQPGPANTHEQIQTFAFSQHQVAGPSRVYAGTPVEDPKQRRRKEIVGRLGKEIADRRDDPGAGYQETIREYTNIAYHLATRPETVPAYQLRLYPISLERSALLASLSFQEKHTLEIIQTAYEEEREKVEEEYKRGRARIRERLLEGIEERKRRAREEKDGEGTVGDGALDSQSRPHITRKLRNKLGGTSPPPTPLSGIGTGAPNGITSISSGPIIGGPFLNPHSLSVDELPSPFPLPLTSTHLTNGTGSGGGAGSGGNTNTTRRRAKGANKDSQQTGVLGRSVAPLQMANCKESELEADLMEIRRGNKRRRAAAASNLANK